VTSVPDHVPLEWRIAVGFERRARELRAAAETYGEAELRALVAEMADMYEQNAREVVKPV
jgi:hypothetical protein